MRIRSRSRQRQITPRPGLRKFRRYWHFFDKCWRFTCDNWTWVLGPWALRTARRLTIYGPAQLGMERLDLRDPASSAMSGLADPAVASGLPVAWFDTNFWPDSAGNGSNTSIPLQQQDPFSSINSTDSGAAPSTTNSATANPSPESPPLVPSVLQPDMFAGIDGVILDNGLGISIDSGMLNNDLAGIDAGVLFGGHGSMAGDAGTSGTNSASESSPSSSPIPGSTNESSGRSSAASTTASDSSSSIPATPQTPNSAALSSNTANHAPLPSSTSSHSVTPLSQPVSRIWQAPTPVTPVISVSNQEVQEGANWNGPVATFIDTSRRDAPTFSAQIDWGDGTTSTGTVASATGQNYVVNGQHAYVHAGSFTLQVTVSNQDGSSASASAPVTVDAAQLTLTGQTFTAAPNDPFAGIVGTLRSSNPLAAPGDFAATVSWSDGSQSAGVLKNLGNGVLTVTGTHIFAQPGIVSATINVTEAGGNSAQTTSDGEVYAPVNGAAGMNLTATAGTEASGIIATFTSSAGAIASDFAAQIDWADGAAASDGMVVALPQGGFAVYGGHTYGQIGGFSPQITITPTGGSAQNVAGNVVVNPPVAGNGGVNGGGNGAGSGAGAGGNGPANGGMNAGNGAMWSNNLGGSPSSNSSEGDSSPATLNGSGVDSDGTEGQWSTYTVATFTDDDPPAGGASFRAFIEWGDGYISPGTVSPNEDGRYTVSGSTMYEEEGSYDVRVVVRDQTGRTLEIDSTATVGDAPLQVQAGSLGATQNVEFKGFVGGFSENVFDTSAGFQATIDWGDGSSSGTIYGLGDTFVGNLSSDYGPYGSWGWGPGGYWGWGYGGEFGIYGDHTYHQAGNYTLTITVTEDDGSTATATGSATVAPNNLAPHSKIRCFPYRPIPSKARRCPPSGNVCRFLAINQ